MRFFQGVSAIILTCIAQATADLDDIAVGHHIIWSYPGPSIPQALFDATKAGKVGGVIFYSENIDKAEDLPGQISSLQDAYRESAGYDGYPLLLVTDQEGGQVNRLPGGPAQSAKAIGASRDVVGAAREAGANVADVFAQYGINADLAPVLDVHRQEGDFTDREQRSFSSDPSKVAEASGQWIEALQQRGFPATAKHFPGLGAAAAEENTDVRHVTINVSADELRHVDMLPYSTAIQSGVKMIMMSWAIYPALDDGHPAGLSRKIVQEELRQRLSFQGVTMTDALEAGSLKPFGDTGQLAVRACQAGMDIVLASVRQVGQGEEAHAAIVLALREGTIDRREFEAATRRIIELRRGL
ncbi:Putative glycoside hydrolase, family 3, glycoside hydrolase superfamily [Septoria linicola]|uniref:Glycoside hydrolase, family 3, glycoside hydrolase superfamily n=1 Tax=Septoria linicola TaxID=215465 RepID=A0A9Q9B8C3_9PEZI|nr:putative glycoside hydrolase, family 3, glycoside hydrolase superfamily [Septoria linicola]USW58241.1 Putative glycoside hydrolase, family 3, glycoside hydrolase superfamily [Septoria linicola]